MDSRKQVLYSIIPTIVITLTVIHLLKPAGIFNLAYFIIINTIVLLQIVLLYIEMKRCNVRKNNRMLYTFLLFSFLPFHYILVWGILKND
jgi:hypothetical protein